MNLAQSKYIMGPLQVGALQFPRRPFEATSRLVWIPSNSTATESSSSSESKLLEMTPSLIVEKSPSVSRNPLNWFGFLVPSSLKGSQQSFTESLPIILEIQKLQKEIEKLLLKLELAKTDSLY